MLCFKCIYLAGDHLAGDGNDESLGDSGTEEKLAFGFISQDPPTEQPSIEAGKSGGDEKEEESGFSFLHLTSGKEGGNVEGSFSEDVDTTHKPQATPPLLVESTPSSTVTSQVGQLERKQELSSPQPPTFQTSSGALSPVPGPISPPLISHSDVSTVNKSHDMMRTPVGKQQPSANKKKKKRKVLR